ncbi:MAG: hypothetical protein AAB250_13200 [Bdellovibrionota bacterium]
MHNRIKDWPNRIAVFLVVLALLAGAVGYIVYMERPSLRKIASNIVSIRRPNVASPTATTASRGFDFRSLISGLIGPEPIRPPHLSAEATDALIARFSESGDLDVRICEMLGELREPPPKGAAEVLAWVSNRVENRIENPFLEALLMPIGAAMARTPMGRIAESVRSAALSGNEAPDFEILQAQAKADLYSAESQLNDVSLRAYHLYAMFNAVNWHPELAQDSATNELCGAIEARLQTAVEGDFSGVSIRSETQELMNWMAANRVTTKESGFNPALGGAISVSVTPTSLEIATPWMKSLLRTGFVLGLPPALEESVHAAD